MILKWKHAARFDMLNTNIDAQNIFEIRCNGIVIPLVSKTTLLGVIIDEYLTLDQHSISICQKVNYKVSVLKKSLYLFDLKFKVILFKLFIQSKFD